MRLISCRDSLGRTVSIPEGKFFFRPSVYGLICDGERIVTMRDRETGAIWFPGGGVEIGERLGEALTREIQEETGLTVAIQQLVYVTDNFFYYRPCDEAYHAFLFFYLCKPLTTELIADTEVNDTGSTSPRWTPITAIEKDDLADLSEELHVVLAGLSSESHNVSSCNTCCNHETVLHHSRPHGGRRPT